MRVLFHQLLFCQIFCLILSQTVVSDKQGNRVIGAGNVWEGNKNNITGQANNVIGDSNQVTGSGNTIQGHNNVVGQLSQDQLIKLQQQMAAQLNFRFGNIFGSAIIPPQSAPQLVSSPTTQQNVELFQNKEKESNSSVSVKQQNSVKEAPSKPQFVSNPADYLPEGKRAKLNEGGLLFQSYGTWPGRPLISWPHDNVSGRDSTWKCQRFGVCFQARSLFFSSVYSQSDR